MSPFRLHLPDDASPLEIARLKNLVRSLSVRAASLIGPERLEGDCLDALGGQFGPGATESNDYSRGAGDSRARNFGPQGQKWFNPQERFSDQR